MTTPKLLPDTACAALGQTGDEASWCYQCGACTATCPWGLVREQPLSIRRLLRAAQLGLPEAGEAAWLCTACAECESVCPRQVPVVDVLRSIRLGQWVERATPTGIPSVLWSMHWNQNPWSQPPSQRTRWAEDLGLPAFDPQAHEILLYIGCAASFDPRGQRIARALVKVLRAAGVAFGVLGEDEPCCGEAALSLGHRPYFEEVRRHTTAVLHERGVRSFVTISPHAFDAFRNHYDVAPDGLQPMHYSAYLESLARDGRLPLTRPMPRTLTYHDPCLLGRRNQIYDEPRRLLEAIPEARLVEMARSRAEALCCGGGGGRMWMETPPGERMAVLRVAEAQATGADIMVTACPFCAVCLEDSLHGGSADGLRVLDLAEVIALAIVGDGLSPMVWDRTS